MTRRLCLTVAACGASAMFAYAQQDPIVQVDCGKSVGLYMNQQLRDLGRHIYSECESFASEHAIGILSTMYECNTSTCEEVTETCEPYIDEEDLVIEVFNNYDCEPVLDGNEVTWECGCSYRFDSGPQKVNCSDCESL